MTTNGLTDAVVEWINGERFGTTRAVMIAEVTRLARHGTHWPKANKEQWEQAICEAIKQGLVVDKGGVLWIAPEQTEAETQLELF